MAQNIAVYDAKDCIIDVGGVIITGVTEDMVTCEKDEEHFTTSVGAQGDVVKNINHNPLGTITIGLQATSPQAVYLRELAESQEDVAIWVTNKSLGIKSGGTKAAVKNSPSISQGKEVGDQEYAFQVFDYSVQAA